MLDRDQYIEQIAVRRQSATNFEHFAGHEHGWELKPPISKSDITGFEEQNSVKLPGDYRDFITQVGNGGVGPWYGIIPFRRDGFHRLLNQPFPHSDAWNVDGLCISEHGDTAEEAVYFDDVHVEGAKRISHLGCGIYAILVFTGAERGNVWIDDRVDARGVFPLRTAKRDRLTFTELFEAWLSHELPEALSPDGEV
jgi:hypothetical protein